MNDALRTDDAVEVKPATVMCVDDEPNILSSLKRLFRPLGYRVLTAESGAAGLQLLEKEERVDLIISDMRMPEMDGAQFLEKVRERWPETIRLLLTGYSDVTSILAAINRGEIYRYITKPWDDNDILLVVRHALERRELELEKERLETLTRTQNDELKSLNASLEAKVEARTADLAASNEAILGANKKLKSNFITTIKIFSSMIEMRGGNLAGHSRRVADLARRIAVKLGLDANDTQEVFIAGLLHDIGKIGFPDELLGLPVNLIVGDYLHIFRKHPIRAEQLLMPLEDLRGVASVLRSHMERFDGAGFPDGLSGMAIPLGALVQRRVLAQDARQIVYDSAGKRYDPAVVAAFRALNEGDPVEKQRDIAVIARDLVPGMVLSRDLVTPDGLMLLSAEHVMDPRMIAKVCDFETKNELRLGIWVWPPKGTP